MATEMKPDDFLSHHFDQHYKSRLPGETKPLFFTTTEAPASSRPMSGPRKFAAVLITVTHIIALYGLYDMMFVLEFTKAFKWFFAAFAMYYITGTMGITAGAHRLWAHRSYSANLPTRIWLMLMNCICNEGSILNWSMEHRIHHIHVDTDADPHNINRGFLFAHCGWLFSPRTDAFVEAKKQVELRDLHDDPVVAFQDKYYSFLGPFFCYILPTIAGYYYAQDAWRGFIYLANLRWVLTLHLTWTINSISHVYGTRPYRSDMKATDNLITSIFSGGEGWHNYHHAYPFDYSASEQQSVIGFNDPSGIDWRFNTARFWIDLFALLGGVSNRKICRNPQRVPLVNPTECTELNPIMKEAVMNLNKQD